MKYYGVNFRFEGWRNKRSGTNVWVRYYTCLQPNHFLNVNCAKYQHEWWTWFMSCISFTCALVSTCLRTYFNDIIQMRQVVSVKLRWDGGVHDMLSQISDRLRLFSLRKEKLNHHCFRFWSVLLLIGCHSVWQKIMHAWVLQLLLQSRVHNHVKYHTSTHGME